MLRESRVGPVNIREQYDLLLYFSFVACKGKKAKEVITIVTLCPKSHNILDHTFEMLSLNMIASNQESVT